MNNSSTADLNRVVADLQERLAEAEETLLAIREGRVDALVIRCESDEEVFTIGGDTEAFRTFMEVMDVGAAAVDASGNVLYANSRLSRLLGTPLERLQGRLLQAVVSSEEADGIRDLIASSDANNRSCEIHIGQGSDRRHFFATAKPLRLGTTIGRAITFTDMTEQIRAEAAEQGSRLLRSVIASLNEAVIVCDADGMITHANAAAAVVQSGDLVGGDFADIPLVFTKTDDLRQSSDLVKVVLGGTAVQGVEVFAPTAPDIKDYLVSAAPLQVDEHQISGCVITMIDLSQRKAAEVQQLLLLRELDHRVKNTLAMVQSISRRTMASENTLEGFREAFTGRIQALAATHTLLAAKSWENLVVRDVVATELAPYVDSQSNRVSLMGLEFGIAPQAAVALGLVVHELTTNAVKYGALSVPHGQISVHFCEQTARDFVTLEWRESNGPPVSPPSRTGFGCTVITRSLQYSPGGGAELLFEPAGVVCRINIPVDDTDIERG